MNIKTFTISPIYEISLFGKILRVAVLRGFISFSLIFNKFLHICRIFSWLWINSLYTTSYRWNFMDQHLIWRSSNKLPAPVFFLRKTFQHTKGNKHYFSLGRMKTNNIRLIKASIYKHRSLPASCLYLEGYTIDSWTVYSLII